MIVCDNGVYRPPTPEELISWESTPEPETEYSDLADKAEAYDILMGVSE